MTIKHLTKITDLSKEDILHIIQTAHLLNEQYVQKGQNLEYFKNKSLAMIFEKPSLRTRVSFEVACSQLGGKAINLGKNEVLQDAMNNLREPILDIAKNLSLFVDLIFARVSSHAIIEELAAHSSVPVINGLCDLHHPTQALADLYTIFSVFEGFPKNLKVAFVGDPCNVATSLMLGCEILGIDFAMAAPEGYEIPDEILKLSNQHSSFSHDLYKAVHGADVIYTDTWVSMGFEEQKYERLKDFAPFQVNANLLKYASPSVKIMHCLPAHRGQEITAEVLDGPASLVLKQSQAKLITAKALIKFLTNL